MTTLPVLFQRLTSVLATLLIGGQQTADTKWTGTLTVAGQRPQAIEYLIPAAPAANGDGFMVFTRGRSETGTPATILSYEGTRATFRTELKGTVTCTVDAVPARGYQ